MAVPGLNAAFTAATQLLGIRSDPYLGHNFLVEIEGLVVGGFTEVTGLQVETEVEEYREGGLNQYVHKLAGPTRYPANLTLRHGLTDREALWEWHQEVAAGRITRRNGSIYLLDQRRLPVMWWNFAEAYPVRWSGPDFRAESANVAVETVELVHRGISKPGGNTVLSAVRGAADLLGL